VESFATDLMSGFLGRRAHDRDAAAAADLIDLRRIAAGLLAGSAAAAPQASRPRDNPARSGRHPGSVCAAAIRRRNPGLYPGLPADERDTGFAHVPRWATVNL
jgi:hypothetical protein